MDDPYIDNTTERSMDEQTRKAMELAREALQRGSVIKDTQAIAAIDAELSAPAAPVAPVVAWMDDGTTGGYGQTTCRVITDETKRGMPQAVAQAFTVPLGVIAAAPVAQPVSEPAAPRAPLTDEQILAMYEAEQPAGWLNGGFEWFRDGIKAAERAHGIGQRGAA